MNATYKLYPTVFYFTRHHPWLALYFFICLVFSIKISGQPKVACNHFTAAMGYKVQSVQIVTRWAQKELQQKVEALIGMGQLFDPAKVSLAQELVRSELIKTEEQFDFQILKGSTSVLYITSDVCVINSNGAAKEVAIVIHPYYLKIDLVNLGNNILPVPRSAKPSFYEQVPVILKATTPYITITNDRKYGAAIGINTLTDVLHIPGIAKLNGGSKSLQVAVGFAARKSMSQPFYSIGSTVELIHPVYKENTIGWNIGISNTESSQPLAEGKNERYSWRFRCGIQGGTRAAFIYKYAIGTGLRLIQSNRTLSTPNREQNDEKGFELYAMADGLPGKKFTRMGIWFDAGIPDDKNNFKNYQRLVTRVGYSIFMGSGHNTAHLETVVGAGYTWGTPPPYGQYYAGNKYQNFLYDPISSVRNQSVVVGPLVRSLGENEGGLFAPAGNIVGGTAFWHINLNFSIPFSKWARALIPDVIISEEPRVSTLRSVLKAQSETAKNFIYDDLVANHNLPDNDETDTKAGKIVDKDIRPTLNYLADRANVFSIKPMLLFDIAGINDQLLNNKVWTAAGLGLQITIVIARLEAGYMHTISPAVDASKGNFFLRFVLQNFY